MNGESAAIIVCEVNAWYESGSVSPYRKSLAISLAFIVVNRRTLLALVGSVVSVPGGYYVWTKHQSLSLPDNMDVDTLYVTGNVFGEPALEDDEVKLKESYHRVIADEETAVNEITFNDSAMGFAGETDFDDSYLIVVQTGMQSEPDLALKSISRTDDGLHLDVAVEHPSWRGVNDDLTTHSLLIRITDEIDTTPESVSVDIEGYV